MCADPALAAAVQRSSCLVLAARLPLQIESLRPTCFAGLRAGSQCMPAPAAKSTFRIRSVACASWPIPFRLRQGSLKLFRIRPLEQLLHVFDGRHVFRVVAVGIGFLRHQLLGFAAGFFGGDGETLGAADLEAIFGHHRADLGEGADEFGVVADARLIQELDQRLAAEVARGARGLCDFRVVAWAPFLLQQADRQGFVVEPTLERRLERLRLVAGLEVMRHKSVSLGS